MTDVHTKKQRSKNMAAIISKNTKPEITVRKTMYKMGLRYRLHRKDLPGKPDIVLGPVNLALFINGCFWHRHVNCKYAYNPKTRKNFWNKCYWKNNTEKNLKRKI